MKYYLVVSDIFCTFVENYKGYGNRRTDPKSASSEAYGGAGIEACCSIRPVWRYDNDGRASGLYPFPVWPVHGGEGAEPPAAEQAIRPQTVQRKNSLFYCSTKGAVNSAIYNTFIETCKQAGVSFREYFRRVILEMKHGRTDYANLLPMTIGLKRY